MRLKSKKLILHFYTSYKCECVNSDWIGKNCDIENPCLSSPCAYDTKCTLTSAYSFECKPIKTEFKKPETDSSANNNNINKNNIVESVNKNESLDLCIINICQNDAVCIVDRIRNGMKCKCKPNYTGIFCENPLLKSHEDYLIPAICDSTQSPKRVSLSNAFSQDSYYLIQGNIYFIKKKQKKNLNIYL